MQETLRRVVARLGESAPVVVTDDAVPRPGRVVLRLEGERPVALQARSVGWERVPEALASLESLQVLDLSGNPIEELPASLKHLPLEDLRLDDCELETWPEVLSQWTSLAALSLDRNRLGDPPPWIVELEQLRKVRLYGNRVVELGGLSALPLLEDLGLGKNRLTEIPEGLWTAGRLVVLNVGENGLTSLSPSIGACTCLRMLDLGHNELASLPGELFELPSLDRFLYLGHNRIETLPGAVASLRRLSYLGLSGNGLRALPEGLGALSELVELKLDGNRLENLPGSIGDLTALRELNANGNRLRSLPGSIGRLRSLRNLELRGNRIAVLPASMGEMARLARLDLRANPLTGLPPGLVGSPALERLDLRWTSVPELDPPEGLQLLQ